MSRPLDKVHMKHLTWMSVGVLVLGIVWCLIAWFASADRIWIIPGIFLIISGIVKTISVLVMTRVAKLGTDEHKPIKAL